MTREEAVKILEIQLDVTSVNAPNTLKLHEALDLAIEALQEKLQLSGETSTNTPTCNQKQITGKLETTENATSEGEESTMNQPKSKLDCISRQQAIEKLESLMKDMENEIEDAKKHPENYTKNFIRSMEAQMAGVAHAAHEIIDMPSADSNMSVTPTERTGECGYCPTKRDGVLTIVSKGGDTE